MPNSGCARKPEIVSVRRPAPPADPSSAPPHTTTNKAKAKAAKAKADDSSDIECVLPCCDMTTCTGIGQRVSSGWSGVLLALLVSGGLMTLVYFGMASSSSDSASASGDVTCASIKDCGLLFNETYTCEAYMCDHKMQVGDLAWVGAGLNLTKLNGHDLIRCVHNASGVGIFEAAKSASLECIESTTNLTLSGWCPVDNATLDFCSDGCDCTAHSNSSNLSIATMRGVQYPNGTSDMLFVQ